jgi:hypothetical protein
MEDETITPRKVRDIGHLPMAEDCLRKVESKAKAVSTATVEEILEGR